MDFVAEHAYASDRSNTATPKPTADSEAAASSPSASEQQRPDLQSEFQETFRAFSNSTWGKQIGGWWSTARTQATSTYEIALKEAEKREAEAAKVLEDAKRAVVERTKTVVEAAENQLDSLVNEEKKAELEEQRKQREAEASKDDPTASREIPREADEDTDTFLARFKAEAAKHLREVQKAEDAADEALLRFGTNIRNFLKDAVSITAPEPAEHVGSSEVLFESRDLTTGKRVIHTSRLDAQLHVIHTTPASFTGDPDAEGGEWEKFQKNFDIESQTGRVAEDLAKYPELRSTMESLVPEKVQYQAFWTRYYFLRHVVEVREEKRKELLKATNADHEAVGWDEDSEDEEVPIQDGQTEQAPVIKGSATAASGQSHSRTDSDAMTLRPARRSHDEKSVADSEASYDLVSGAASHATSSPKEKPIKEEDSDDDWE